METKIANDLITEFLKFGRAHIEILTKRKVTQDPYIHVYVLIKKG